MQKVRAIFLNAVPVLVMIGLIPFVQNDYLLAAVYIGIIAFSLKIKYVRHDLLTFLVGAAFMTASETLFISTPSSEILSSA